MAPSPQLGGSPQHSSVAFAGDETAHTAESEGRWVVAGGCRSLMQVSFNGLKALGVKVFDVDAGAEQVNVAAREPSHPASSELGDGEDGTG